MGVKKSIMWFSPRVGSWVVKASELATLIRGYKTQVSDKDLFCLAILTRVLPQVSDRLTSFCGCSPRPPLPVSLVSKSHNDPKKAEHFLSERMNE